VARSARRSCDGIRYSVYDVRSNTSRIAPKRTGPDESWLSIRPFSRHSAGPISSTRGTLSALSRVGLPFPAPCMRHTVAAATARALHGCPVDFAVALQRRLPWSRFSLGPREWVSLHPGLDRTRVPSGGSPSSTTSGDGQPGSAQAGPENHR
jgi:hypothetical protein